MPWITELKTEKRRDDGSPFTITKYRVGSFKNGRRKFKTFTNEKDAKAFSKALGKILLNKEYNTVLAGGQGKLAGKIVRIGHMGLVEKQDVAAAVAALGSALARLGFESQAAAPRA